VGVVLGADLVVVEGDVQMAGIDHLVVVAMPAEEECPIVGDVLPIVGDAVLEVDQRNQDAVVGQTVGVVLGADRVVG